jgi:hypothetical protein
MPFMDVLRTRTGVAPLAPGRGVGVTPEAPTRRDAAALPAPTEVLPLPGVDAAASGFALERGRAIERSEHSAAVQRLRRSLWVGFCIWFGTLPFDVGVALLTGEGHLPTFLALRGLGLVLALPIARLSRLPEPSPRALIALDLFTFTSASVLVSLMSLTYRGIASPYAPAIIVILVGRGAMSAAPWRQGAWLFGIPALAYPCTVLLAACFDPGVAAQLRDVTWAAPFASILYMLLETWALLTVGGHFVWQVRREAIEMRNIGRYQLERRLGSGGMAEVWAAFDTTLKQRVALKTVSGHRPGSPLLERLEREVQALAGLRHPNTVRVFDYGVTQEGLWYYAMELLHGETLRDAVLRQGALAPERVVLIARQVLNALGEAHDKGLIHRDIKPENVFLCEAEGPAVMVKLLDFGIAKATATPDLTLTRTGYVAGTPAYMAPELILGRPASVRSDLYSFGATLYFALSARLPFAEDDLMTLFAAHLHRQPEPASSVAPGPIPRALEQVVQRCMEKLPADRYASTQAVLEALQA